MPPIHPGETVWLLRFSESGLPEIRKSRVLMVGIDKVQIQYRSRKLEIKIDSPNLHRSIESAEDRLKQIRIRITRLLGIIETSTALRDPSC